MIYPGIEADVGVCGGRPCVAGTRMRVRDVLELLASGATEAEIARDYPYVSVAAVRACLAFAAHQLSGSVVALAAE